jgi:hypothetical protein
MLELGSRLKHFLNTTNIVESNMRPTTEMLRTGAVELAKVTLQSFTASPNPVRPFEQATVSWQVDLGGTTDVRLRLVGPGVNMFVGTAGSRQVAPSTKAIYTLTAFRFLLSKVLGSLVLDFDDSACITGTVDEPDVRERLVAKIDAILEEKSELRRRREDVVEIDPNGIHLSLRFKALVEHWVNPKINLDATIRLRIQEGRATYTLASYTFDIDFPWWADVVHGTLLPAWLALAIREGSQESEFRGKLTDGIEEILVELNSLVDSLRMRFLRLETVEEGVSYTMCPL